MQHRSPQLWTFVARGVLGCAAHPRGWRPYGARRRRRDILVLSLREALGAVVVGVTCGTAIGYGAVRIVSSKVVAVPSLVLFTLVAVSALLALRATLDSRLGKPKRKQRDGRVTFSYRLQPRTSRRFR